jgi:hypothetical protein
MVFYDHYTVKNCRLRIWFTADNDTNVNSSNFIGGVIPVDNSTSLSGSSLTELQEQGRCKYAYIGESNSAVAFREIKYNLNIQNFFARKDIMDNSDLKGSSSANPTEGVFFHVFASPISTSYTITAAHVHVNFEYDVQFSEPKLLASS